MNSSNLNKKVVLVLGASGFLGSHVTKLLVAAGHEVRILCRASSDTSATAHLDLERFIGDVNDYDSLSRAMKGVDHVYHCVVDTRAWLRDPAPLYKVNIEGLKNSMNAALENQVQRFIYTSTYATIGKNASGVSTENDEFRWQGDAPVYVQCRVDAENLFFEYCREKGLPGVACCVGNTYGEADIQPTPHGKLLLDVAKGRMPFYWDGGGPTVNVRDAAAGMLLAAEKGEVGQRYILAGPFIPYQELFAMAAKAAGRRPPGLQLSVNSLQRMGKVIEFFTKPFNIENKMNQASIDCSTLLPAVSSLKAKSELGWQPGTPEEAVTEAVEWYLANT